MQEETSPARFHSTRKRVILIITLPHKLVSRLQERESAMSIWSLASNASCWRGYDLHTEGRVTSYTKIGEYVYESFVQGSAGEPYHTVINVEHPRQSHCDCPFAEGRRVICKHMVALHFAVFPSEVEAFMHEVEESEREEERRAQEHRDDLERYVKTLKKDELQRQLLDALLELEERESRYW